MPDVKHNPEKDAAKLHKKYVDIRKKDINKKDPDRKKGVTENIENYIKFRLESGEPTPITEVAEVYNTMNRALKERDLTINIDAASWFSQANTYSTYMQAYEKGSTGGQTRLVDTGKGNDPFARAQVDDVATLPAEWQHAKSKDPRRQIWESMHFSGKTPDRVVGTQIAEDAGKMVKIDDKTFTTSNANFNPHAKQVFAALNYGRRPHGSSTYYGFSHLILKPKLKEDSFYFAGDTFNSLTGGAGKGKGTRAQVSYEKLAALTEFAGFDLLDALYRSCILDEVLEDYSEESGLDLIEAHLFRKVKLQTDVEALVLSRHRLKAQATQPWQSSDWNRIVQNALAWCQRNNAKFLMAGS